MPSPKRPKPQGPKRGSKPAPKHSATDAPKRKKAFKPGVKPKPAPKAGKRAPKRSAKPVYKREDNAEKPAGKPAPKRSAKAAPKRTKSVSKRPSSVDSRRVKRNTATGSSGAVFRRNRTGKGQGPPEGKLRIQKYLADAGFASRRGIEEMIAEGRIDLNGETIVKLPCFVAPEVDDIRIDGQHVRFKRHKLVYFLLNKPKGVVCTSSDPQGRPVAVEMIPSIKERIYCVGRLDVDSTGIMLLTNDGELTQHLTHPSYEVTKTYRVTVSGRVEADSIEKLRRGMYLDGKRTQGAEAVILRRGINETVLEMTLREGRNREIRRMLLRLRHGVKKLHRIRIGSISDKGLKVGNVRSLTGKEIRQLRNAGISK